MFWGETGAAGLKGREAGQGKEGGGLPVAHMVPYECPLCHQQFLKHQGLGGHMKRHRHGSKHRRVPSSPAAFVPSGVEASASTASGTVSGNPSSTGGPDLSSSQKRTLAAPPDHMLALPLPSALQRQESRIHALTPGIQEQSVAPLDTGQAQEDQPSPCEASTSASLDGGSTILTSGGGPGLGDVLVECASGDSDPLLEALLSESCPEAPSSSSVLPAIEDADATCTLPGHDEPVSYIPLCARDRVERASKGATWHSAGAGGVARERGHGAYPGLQVSSAAPGFNDVSHPCRRGGTMRAFNMQESQLPSHQMGQPMTGNTKQGRQTGAGEERSRFAMGRGSMGHVETVSPATPLELYALRPLLDSLERRSGENRSNKAPRLSGVCALESAYRPLFSTASPERQICKPVSAERLMAGSVPSQDEKGSLSSPRHKGRTRRGPPHQGARFPLACRRRLTITPPRNESLMAPAPLPPRSRTTCGEGLMPLHSAAGPRGVDAGATGSTCDAPAGERWIQEWVPSTGDWWIAGKVELAKEAGSWEEHSQTSFIPQQQQQQQSHMRQGVQRDPGTPSTSAAQQQSTVGQLSTRMPTYGDGFVVQSPAVSGCSGVRTTLSRIQCVPGDPAPALPYGDLAQPAVLAQQAWMMRVSRGVGQQALHVLGQNEPALSRVGAVVPVSAPDASGVEGGLGLNSKGPPETSEGAGKVGTQLAQDCAVQALSVLFGESVACQLLGEAGELLGGEGSPGGGSPRGRVEPQALQIASLVPEQEISGPAQGQIGGCVGGTLVGTGIPPQAEWQGLQGSSMLGLGFEGGKVHVDRRWMQGELGRIQKEQEVLKRRDSSVKLLLQLQDRLDAGL